MFGKLVLHIGLPKTATTTLQQGLFCRLPEDEFLYLGNELKTFAAATINEQTDREAIVRQHRWIQKWVCRFPALMPLYKLHLGRVLKARGPRIYIISEEFFTNFFFVELKLLRKFLSVYVGLFKKIEVVLCLRSPILHFNSMVATYGRSLFCSPIRGGNTAEIRAGEIVSAFQKISKETQFYNYERLVKGLALESSNCSLKVQYYEDFVDHPIIFLSQWDEILSLPRGESVRLVGDLRLNTREVVEMEDRKFYRNRLEHGLLTEILEPNDFVDEAYENLRRQHWSTVA